MWLEDGGKARNSEELCMGADNNLPLLTAGVVIWKTSVEILQSSGLRNRQNVWPEGSNSRDVSVSSTGKSQGRSQRWVLCRLKTLLWTSAGMNGSIWMSLRGLSTGT